MRTLNTVSAAALLDAWEHGRDASPGERGLHLLEIAEAPATRETLVRWAVGQRDTALLAFQERLFGPSLSALADCPRCGEALALEFPLASLVQPGLDEADVLPGPDERVFVLDAEGYKILYRLPTAGDLADLGRNGHDADGRWLLKRCVVGAERLGEGADAGPDAGQRWASLDASGQAWEALEAALGRTAAECDPQAEIELALNCPTCGLHWQTQLDIVGFLWREIDVWAAGVLRDVHVLAATYGWSERDILALSASRRRHYLNLIGE